MILFRNNNIKEPYSIFRKKYYEALSANQKLIEAISVASFCKNDNEINARFVNLKMVDDDKFIFFTNYNSPKAIEFKSHNQIAISIFWESTSTQIRMKATIKKTTNEFNQRYFFDRSKEKNALAISSNQSKPVDSYNQVKENYNKSLKNDDLKKCPKYWGGYTFTPYEIEFWEGNEFRLNKRNLYRKDNTIWTHYILEP
jgi:pyridoxamine 5'-phosphate oxidase